MKRQEENNETYIKQAINFQNSKEDVYTYIKNDQSISHDLLQIKDSIKYRNYRWEHYSYTISSAKFTTIYLVA